MTRRAALLSFVVVALALGGCRHIEAANRRDELEAQMQPLVGKGPQDVVLAVGAPTSSETIAGVTVYHYWWPHGERRVAAISHNAYLAVGASKRYETFDRLDVFFQDDRVVKYSYEVVR